jgi:hypothetical protein
VSKTFAIHFNGTTWAVKSTPSPSPSVLPANYLADVSCISATTCVAVGQYQNPAFTVFTLVINWNGATWTQAPTPTLPTGLQPRDLACTAANFCMGVGTYQSHSQGFTWNGSAWTLTTMPNQGTTAGPALESVSCTSATQCVAIGGISNALMEFWNGSTWSIGATAPLGYLADVDLRGVHCTSSGYCISVGSQHAITDQLEPLQTIAFSGQLVGNGRTFTVSWTDTEAVRLDAVATYLGETPVSLHKTSVYIIAYLIGFAPPTPVPTVLPAPGTAATYAITFDAAELSVINSVKAKFVLNDADATRFSVQIVEFLVGLGGH